MKTHTFITCILLATHSIYCQEAVPASFGTASGTDTGTISYSVGQLGSNTHAGNNGSVADGIYSGAENKTLPGAGTVFITEVVNAASADFDYLELFNNSDEIINLGASKLVKYTADGVYDNFVYDFGSDESGADADITIPAFGFLIIARSGSRADFNASLGITLPAGVHYNTGSVNNSFGETSRWQLKADGNLNTDDGILIDDTETGVGTNKDFRNIFTDTFTEGDAVESTPGALEYLIYNGGAWVNETEIDETTSAKDAYIYDDLIISANSEINNFGIAVNKTVSLNASNHLNVNGNLTTNNGLTLASGSSLIVSGTAVGSVVYQRTLEFEEGNTNGWYLMTSPVANETYNDAWVNTNDIASGSSNNRGIATYTTATDDWSYFQANGSDSFTSGIGYSMKRGNLRGSVSFTGNINTAIVTPPISIEGKAYNLLGVPYTSYINSGIFLEDNSNLEQQIWLWNKETENYESKPFIDAYILSPGQGFFVKAASGSTVTFAKTNQSSGTDTFQKSAMTEVKLIMTDGTNERFAKIYYLENATTGFDNGYEGETFGSIANSIDVFTRLVAEDQGKNYQVQSLPISEITSLLISVGVKVAADKEIIFSTETAYLPQEVKVYLEDRFTNTFTRLDVANSFYKVLVPDGLNDIGRFYLHISKATLSTDTVLLQNISMYQADASTLRIIGLDAGQTTFTLFNTLGKQMRHTSFESNGVKDISVSNLAAGMYIVTIETSNGSISKKLILE